IDFKMIVSPIRRRRQPGAATGRGASGRFKVRRSGPCHSGMGIADCGGSSKGEVALGGRKSEVGSENLRLVRIAEARQARVQFFSGIDVLASQAYDAGTFFLTEGASRTVAKKLAALVMAFISNHHDLHDRRRAPRPRFDAWKRY